MSPLIVYATGYTATQRLWRHGGYIGYIAVKSRLTMPPDYNTKYYYGDSSGTLQRRRKFFTGQRCRGQRQSQSNYLPVRQAPD